MPKILPHKKSIERSRKVRKYQSQVVSLNFNEGLQPVLIELGDGTKGRGTCLGCDNAPCMMLSATEMKLPQTLEEFPGDPTREVCPTQAITWNDLDDVAVVNSDACISCGICVARCPYGAISLSHEGVAVVESNDPDRLTVTCANASGKKEHIVPARVGQMGPIDFAPMRQIPELLADLNDHQNAQLIRNLLIECGIPCQTRRRGDTNVRMDGVLSTTEGRIGVLEIELSNAVLESPRALLEDVAVMHGRYGHAVENIDPVSVILCIPNKRSEYFRVIRDIERILGLRCRTITVGALLAVLWHFKKITGFPGNLFMTSPDDTDLLPPMRHYLSDTISAFEPYPSAYRPSK